MSLLKPCPQLMTLKLLQTFFIVFMLFLFKYPVQDAVAALFICIENKLSHDVIDAFLW
jgi:hypothetical protein